MKPILIQGAMNVEVDFLIQKLNAVLDHSIAGFNFYKGFYFGYPIVISKTNIGLSNASCATTVGILTYNPIMIINQGTAGAHSLKVNTGDIILGVQAKNICSFEKSALDTGVDYKLWKHTNFFDYDDGDYMDTLIGNQQIIDAFGGFKYQNGKVHVGVIGSGDVWNKEIEFLDFLNVNLQTLCEDMETSSVYNVANRFKVPVLGVRVISNNEILKQSYDKNSANYCQQFIFDNLKELTKVFTCND